MSVSLPSPGSPSRRPSRLRLALLPAALGAALGVAGAGCSAPPGSAPEAVGQSQQAITGSSIVARADEWVVAKLLYCQAANGQPDYDTACPSICTRESNPDWDPYRSDCSGFVSWAWGLPPPGLVTSEFAPADTTNSYVIDGTDLQPGDALNVPSDHIILFVSWITPGSEANFYEEPGCSASPNYAHAFSSTVSISGSDVYVDYEGMTFTAIRYVGFTGAGDGGADAGVAIPCTVTTTGETGDCMETTACAAKGGTSTPGYCPGPDDFQCCTGIPAPVPDAGAPADDAGAPPKHHHGDDAGSAPAEDDAGTSGGHRNHHESGGCSTSPGRGDGAAAWMLALGAAACIAGRRRRRP